MRDSPKVQWINVLAEAIHRWLGEDRAPRDSPGYYYRTHNGEVSPSSQPRAGVDEFRSGPSHRNLSILFILVFYLKG